MCPLLMSLYQIILSHFLRSVFHKVTLLVYIKIQRRPKFPRESIHNINVFLIFGDNFDSSFFYDSNEVINYRNGLDRNNTNASSKWMVTLGSGHHSMNNKLSYNWKLKNQHPTPSTFLSHCSAWVTYMLGSNASCLRF